MYNREKTFARCKAFAEELIRANGKDDAGAVFSVALVAHLVGRAYNLNGGNVTSAIAAGVGYMDSLTDKGADADVVMACADPSLMN